MRKIVELCHNPRKKTLPFLIEGLKFVSTVAGDETVFDLLSPNSTTTSQIRCKDQSVLAPPQRTIENVEFFLIIRLGSNHLIANFPYLLDCRLHLRHILVETSDKDVITMHCPCNGTRLVAKAASHHNTNGETAQTSPFLNSSLHDAAAGSSVQRLAQLPNVCCAEFGWHVVWEFDKSASLLCSVEKRSPNVKHGCDNVFTLGPSSCVRDHSFDQCNVRRF